MFDVAQEIATHSRLCYVNADIILLSDFTAAVQRVPVSSFLMVGQRWDLDVDEPVDFSLSDWETEMRRHVRNRGSLHSPMAIDYFVFTRGLFTEMPAFAVGRPAWDNWMIHRARSLRVPVINATPVVTAVHQDHEYGHPRGRVGIYRGPEATRNRALAGGPVYVFDVRDATHVLTEAGVKRSLGREHLKRRLETLPVLSPHLGPLLWPSKAWLLLKRMRGRVMRAW